MLSNQKIALITGATSGIGKACANIYAQNGYNIIITGRRLERLSQIKNDLESKYDIQVTTLNFDVRNKDEVSNTPTIIFFNICFLLYHYPGSCSNLYY